MRLEHDHEPPGRAAAQAAEQRAYFRRMVGVILEDGETFARQQDGLPAAHAGEFRERGRLGAAPMSCAAAKAAVALAALNSPCARTTAAAGVNRPPSRSVCRSPESAITPPRKSPVRPKVAKAGPGVAPGAAGAAAAMIRSEHAQASLTNTGPRVRAKRAANAASRSA